MYFLFISRSQNPIKHSTTNTKNDENYIVLVLVLVLEKI